MELKNGVCIVTGSATGIGAACALQLAQRGCRTVINYTKSEGEARATAKLCEEHGTEALLVRANVAEDADCHRMADAALAKWGRIDALVNNAGYGVPGKFVASPWERHDDMLQVMVTGLAELTHRLLPGMIERGYGRILNVASLAGLVPAPAGHTLYAASKALVIKFSEALSHEVRRHGIHVTAVCPGFTYSEFHDVIGTREQMDKLPSWMWLDSPTVARQGYEAVMAGTPVYINGRVNRTIALLVRLLPQVVVKTIGRRFGRSYRKT